MQINNELIIGIVVPTLAFFGTLVTVLSNRNEKKQKKRSDNQIEIERLRNELEEKKDEKDECYEQLALMNSRFSRTGECKEELAVQEAKAEAISADYKTKQKELYRKMEEIWKR